MNLFLYFQHYADVLYAAATEAEDQRARHGQRLHEFIMNNDIERWSQAFLDPGWSHLVIRQTPVETLDDFYTLMMRSRDVRRQIVERVLKGEFVDGVYLVMAFLAVLTFTEFRHSDPSPFWNLAEQRQGVTVACMSTENKYSLVEAVQRSGREVRPIGTL